MHHEVGVEWPDGQKESRNIDFVVYGGEEYSAMAATVGYPTGIATRMVLNGMYRAVLQCQKLGKIFTGPANKSLLSFIVISDVYKSCIPDKTTFIRYCITQWVSKLHRSFEIYWVRQYIC